MQTPDYAQILKQHWGYDRFRPAQREIIESVGAGRDTLGLLPTGGGKSITFQVPALSRPGVCLVVTPLIALMKDQVQNLKARGIKAYAIYTGMRRDDIDTMLWNCVYGEIKFLYVSPERLQSEAFRLRFPEMKVNLIAVDEAHCISQWGYDFRPSYLQIAAARELQPGVPVLALTATATPRVVDDIQEKLLFKEKNVFQKSFERKNLVYWVKESDDKDRDLLHIARRNPGTGIVYVRNRKKTQTVAEMLQAHGVAADYYHAGLTPEDRDRRQNDWKEDRTRVIVATNAFGMGIDKPDVRYVVHIDLPDSLEAYFQEAGRGGRDEQTAHAILLYSSHDRAKLRQNLTNSFPPVDYIRGVYDNLGSYMQVAVGEGKGHSGDFSIGDFATRHKLSAVQALSALKTLESEGYIALTEEVNIPPRVKFLVGRDDLYNFQVANLEYDAFIKLLLRSYTGLFTDYRPIDETLLARRAQCPQERVHQYLLMLSRAKVISYIPHREKPQVIFLEERLQAATLYISQARYDERRRDYSDKIEAAIRYAESREICRSRLLLEYFGDRRAADCGQCDVCARKRAGGTTNNDLRRMVAAATQRLRRSPARLAQLVPDMGGNEEQAIEAIRWLKDQRKIEVNENGEYYLVKQ